MNAYPTKLELLPDDQLLIAWSDGQRRHYRFRELRDSCPCATCREKRNAPAEAAPMFNILSDADVQPLKISGMKPVGNYAYSIEFSDGHDTGIYTFEFLRSLGQAV